MMVPRYVRAASYRTEFVAFMVVFDALGLYGLVRIARRTGSWWGAATWFLLVPALGPVTYTRLDMVVAVIFVWTLERALASRWGHVGVLVAAGTAVKLVPVCCCRCCSSSRRAIGDACSWVRSRASSRWLWCRS